jgi:quinol monooxygenase YgiN
LNTLIDGTRNEKGNIRYDWFQDSKAADTMIIIEKFANAEAFKVHIKSSHFK